MTLEIRSPRGVLGTVADDGTVDDEWIGIFLDGLVVPGKLRRGQPGYTDALYALLRGGTYLWAEPTAAPTDTVTVVT